MKPEKQLYQWDTNQSLVELTPSAQFVDYPIGDEVIRIEADGTRCRIPDEVLQTYGGKTCYERYTDGTFRAYSFTVLYAPKPPDYVYTPEERTTFEALTARVDAAIEEIKRRADSGEFTPVKGVDYFTDEEKTELMESVSSGAVGEFRKVVDTATTEYNANASEKLTTYNTNAEQHTTDYNRNAAEKLEAYNQNAENKTAEFDANAAALQTEVDRLRGECDTLAAENRKQENRIDALIKLNKGQTYDILPEEGEAASRTAPSGAKYLSVDKVGGKSIVWNQLVDFHNESSLFKNGELDTVYRDGKWYFSNYQTDSTYAYFKVELKNNHKYFLKFDCDAVFDNEQNPAFGFYKTDYITPARINLNSGNNKIASIVTTSRDSNDRLEFRCQYNNNNCSITVYSMIFVDMTLMFGTGNEPSTVEEFEAMFPDDYYPYSEPTIISSQTDRLDVASADGTTQQITTGFPVLNSAGSVYDYIDLNEGKLHQRVGKVDLGTLNWVMSDSYLITRFQSSAINDIVQHKGNDYCSFILCSKYNSSNIPITSANVDKCIASYSKKIYVTDSSYTSRTDFIKAMSGVMLYYELAEEIITDIDIPTELTDWIEVEAGGTVTFQNSDDTKQLQVPNAVSWVRKLNEVE